MFFCSVVDVAVAETPLLMILEMCPWDFHQAEALNDDVALSSLENEIQGAAQKSDSERGLVAFFGGKGDVCLRDGIWEME